jgi:type IV secretory pathway VirB2 component (pilin)
MSVNTYAADGDECAISNTVKGKEFGTKCYTVAEYNIRVACKANPKAATCKDLEDPNPGGRISNTFQSIVNILLAIAGIIAIIVIITSGIKFASSRGDSSATTKARQTLTFAVVGLVITLLAFAIVNFVIGQINK